MWQSIQSVSGWASLGAFIVAGVVTVIGVYIRNDSRKIRSAPEDERASLIRDSLEFFHVDPRNLNREMQERIAIKQIEARANRFRQVAVMIVIVATVLALLAATAILFPSGLTPTPAPGPAPEPPSKISSLEQKTETQLQIVAITVTEDGLDFKLEKCGDRYRIHSRTMVGYRRGQGSSRALRGRYPINENV